MNTNDRGRIVPDPHPDDVYAASAQEYWEKEVLLTMCLADRAALDGCQIEAMKHSATLQMGLSMARSVASNSYHVESREFELIPATLPDWFKTLIPKRWRRWQWMLPRLVAVGYTLDLRHMCPHLGNRFDECRDFLRPPGQLHGEESFLLHRGNTGERR